MTHDATVHIIDAPTAGKRVKVVSSCDVVLERDIQEAADDGWSFAGIIESYYGSVAMRQFYTLLFMKDKT